MRPLHPTKMRHAADYIRTIHMVVVDPTDTIEDVLTPAFWAHHADRLRMYDLIDVISDTFDMQLRVTGKGIGLVETRVLRKWESDAPAAKLSADEIAAIEATIPDGYHIDHTPKTGWRAKLTDTGTEISRNHKSKVEAIQSALDHSRRAQGIAA